MTLSQPCPQLESEIDAWVSKIKSAVELGEPAEIDMCHQSEVFCLFGGDASGGVRDSIKSFVENVCKKVGSVTAVKVCRMAKDPCCNPDDCLIWVNVYTPPVAKPIPTPGEFLAGISDVVIPPSTAMVVEQEAFGRLHKEATIKRAKSLRQSLDAVLQELKSFKDDCLASPCMDMPKHTWFNPSAFANPSEVIANSTLSQRHLEDAIMRLGMVLKSVGNPTPYPESYNPESTKVEPTADGLKL
jgi:hypothetical protein